MRERSRRMSISANTESAKEKSFRERFREWNEVTSSSKWDVPRACFPMKSRFREKGIARESGYECIFPALRKLHGASSSDFHDPIQNSWLNFSRPRFLKSKTKRLR